ncbi:dephospho-CoA kinase [Nitrolancea hollandica]|uniref:Dephospho-CoA kinase n=1 Tax=Nitrolancea hollandica Lb TaxID=1129897 RepID=I4EFC7_9BACT|nr:dephospho-CoA kinase [Nitrolancea hollandica]CCF83389.1 Dephospho-CoA kinase [Nitrolancea hollandica Lb]
MSTSRPVIIGITGNIACGKSLVTRTLGDLGAETIDADDVVREVTAVGTPAYHRIVEAFGPELVLPGGAIDRRRLGEIVFADPGALARLEAIVHPPVVETVRQRIRTSRSRVVVVDAIKLLESRLAAECDEIWVVTCDPDQQLQRLMARNGYSREQALQRITAQPSQAEKIALASRVIDNTGSIEATVALVRSAAASLPLGNT